MKGLVRQKRSTWGYQFQLPPGPDGAKRYASKYGFATRAEAEAALAEALVEFNGGRRIEPKRMTLAQYLTDEWLPLARGRTKVSTANRYRSLAGHIAADQAGALQLQGLTAGDVRRLLGRLGGRMSATSVNHCYTMLSKALTDGVSLGYLPRNPAKGVTPPARRDPEKKTWSVTELQCFLESAAGRDDPLLGLWLLVATTGLRRGEALGLAWDAVDLEAGAVEVRRARVKGEHNEVTVTTPKTKQGRRTVDLEPEVMAVLRRQRAEQAEGRLGSGERPAEGEPDWLWPLHPDACDNRWHRAVEAAGVVDIGIHGLRHTWATLALRDGVAPTLVSSRLGHRKVSFTLDVYSHAVPDWAKAEASRVNGRLLGRNASVMD